MSTNFKVMLLIAAAGAGCGLEPQLGELGEELVAGYQATVKNGILTIIGGDEDSRLALRLQGPTTLAVDVGDDGTADFLFDRATFTRVAIDARGGADVVRMDESQGQFTLDIPVTITGGAGNDTLLGGIGAETFFGGGGNDVVTPGRGADVVSLGSGTDTVIWNPGDGSDAVEGDGGSDTLLFNGANIDEHIDVSAEGDHVRFTRDVGAIAMDLHGVELVQFNARGGADNVVVGELAGTGAKRVIIDLAGLPGDTAGDALADVVVVNGAPLNGAFAVDSVVGAVTVSGPAAAVTVTHGDADLDRLLVASSAGERVNLDGTDAGDTISLFPVDGSTGAALLGAGVIVVSSGAGQVAVNGRGGDDTIIASSGLPLLPLIIDGGGGNDTIVGGPAADTVLGGTGDDTINGGRGDDHIDLGGGNDTVSWNPGDGSDTIEGAAGSDTMMFNGSNIGENIAVGAAGEHVIFTRDVAAITMDLHGVEQIQFNALGGADAVVVGDLAGTLVKRVTVDLGAFFGSPTGDGLADSVIVDQPAGALDVTADGAAVVARGGAAEVRVIDGEPGLDGLFGNTPAGSRVNVNGSAAADTIALVPVGDTVAASVVGFNVFVAATGAGQLAVNGLDGDDSIIASSAVLAPVLIDGGRGDDTLVGGSGDDTLLGGPGADAVFGGRGADTVSLGSGVDTFIWNPGDGSDAVEGDDGDDTMVFNGSNIGEQIVAAASGDHLRFTRDVGQVTMDTHGVEAVLVNARGGADAVTVNDLTGTRVERVTVDLAGIPGDTAGDGLADLVVVNGTAAADRIGVVASGGSAVVNGLPATVEVAHPETGDALVVNGAGGIDQLTADPLVPGLLTLTLNQD